MNPHILAVAGPLFLLSSLALAADPPQPTPYSLREVEPSTGSNITRSVAAGSAIPFNKRYNELTPEQQRLVKSQYETMADGDEPPFPRDGLRNIYRAIADGQQKLLVEGDLSMFVEINAQGKATAVSVFKSPSPEMTQLAASILMLEQYKPAICANKPCAMAFPFRISLSKR